MSRWAVFPNSNRTLRCIFFGTALTTQCIAIADDGPADAQQPAKYPTPENLAYEAAREKAGVAYISCLGESFRNDAALSVADAQSNCADQGKQYAEYLPSDVSDQTLLLIAYRVKEKP